MPPKVGEGQSFCCWTSLQHRLRPRGDADMAHVSALYFIKRNANQRRHGRGLIYGIVKARATMAEADVAAGRSTTFWLHAGGWRRAGHE